MGQALRQPKIIPSLADARAPASPRGGGGGVQPPLLVQIISDRETSPSPQRENPETPDRRLELGGRLCAAGIFQRKARELAASWPAEHIEGWLKAWEADRAGAEGPGALVWRIEHEEPPAVQRSAEADWLERRYEAAVRKAAL